VLSACLYNAGPTGPVRSSNIRQLWESPQANPGLAGSWVRVRGKFMPYGDHQFTLARMRIFCCGGDAIELQVPVICREKLRDQSGNWVVRDAAIVRAKDWVEITGRVEFRLVGRAPAAILEVPNVRLIKAVSPDLDPYVY
jgi:hypothetical protein